MTLSCPQDVSAHFVASPFQAFNFLRTVLNKATAPLPSRTRLEDGITRIFGDQFCSEPIRQALAAEGVEFVQRTTLGSRAQCFNTLRTLVTSGQIELLDDAETIAELKRLEQVVTNSGIHRVEATSGHDDRSVSLALAAHESVANPVVTPWIETIRVNRNGRDVEYDEDGVSWTRL